MWGRGRVSCHALPCRSDTHGWDMKGSEEIIHMTFQPGLALVCNLISVGHLQKGLAELKARSLPRKPFLSSFASLFLWTLQLCRNLHRTQLWLHANRDVAPHTDPSFTPTALTTDELQKKNQEEFVGCLLTTKALSHLPEVSCRDFYIPG